MKAREGVEISTCTLLGFIPLCLHKALGCSATRLLPLFSTTAEVHWIYQHINILKSIYLKVILFSSAFLLFLSIASSKSSWSLPVITFTFSSVWQSSTNSVLLLVICTFLLLAIPWVQVIKDLVLIIPWSSSCLMAIVHTQIFKDEKLSELLLSVTHSLI